MRDHPRADAAMTTDFPPPAETSRFGRPRTEGQRLLAQWLWFAADLASLLVSVVLADALAGINLDFSHPTRQPQFAVIALIAAIQGLVYLRRGLYRYVLRYSGIEVLTTIAFAVIVALTMAVVATYFLSMPNTGGLGRTFLVIYAFCTIAISGGLRLAARMAIERKTASDAQRVLIYGSGSIGEQVLRELRSDPRYHVVGFLDDNPTRKSAIIRGFQVLGGMADLPHLLDNMRLGLLVIADRAFPPASLRQVFQICLDRDVQVKVVARTALQRLAHVQITDLALEDLLRRPQRSLDRSRVERMLKGRCVMITGAGGSIGSELCRQIAAAGALELVLLDHSEFNLYQIDDQLGVEFPHVSIKPVLATLADYDNLMNLLGIYRPQIVFHAAAYKHVPMVEENPFLGMANNLGGFNNLLKACIANRVDQVVMISTDKAVRPTNIMGASKRACEVLMQNIASGQTRLCAVRFGNVLGSSGSVIPHFLKQIARGGPVTVTHPDISRYFMLLPEAVELVLQAGAIAQPGEIFILDMGQPVKIVNLARQLIFMTGHVPGKDMQIRFTGMRPGEKLIEELLLDEAEKGTTVDGITIARSTRRNEEELHAQVEELLESCRTRSLEKFIHITKRLVPEWIPSDDFNQLANGKTDIFEARKS
jgi:FlaA1/EpsC-like NDP-sugar epimerase